MHAGGGVSDGPSHYYDSKDPFEELVAYVPSRRNWKGILISIVVILAVGGLVACTVILVTPPKGPPRVKGEKITQEQMHNGSFLPNPVNATWISGSVLAYINADGGLSVFNVVLNETKQICDNTTFRLLQTTKFHLSPNQHYLILVHQFKSVHRYSSVARYSLVNLESRSDSGVQGLLNGSLIQKIAWVGSQGLVLIKDNNIYYQPNLNTPRVVTVTRSGEPGTIYNGIPDWIYEVEVFKSDEGMWVSPDGRLLAYCTWDDTNVTLHQINGFKEKGKTEVRYPFAGETNPTVNLTIVQLGEGEPDKTWKLEPPAQLVNMDWYIASVGWADNQTLSVSWMPRSQAYALHTLCFPPQYTCTLIAGDLGSQQGEQMWVDIQKPPVFSPDLSSMVMLMSTDQGDEGFFRHIVKYRVSREVPPSLPTEITRGRFEVTELLCWDHQIGIIYFTATLEGKPELRHLFKVSDSGLSAPECISCPQEPLPSVLVNSSIEEDSYRYPDSYVMEVDCSRLERASFCEYSEILVSPSCQAYVQVCQGPCVPYSTVNTFRNNSPLLNLDFNDRLYQTVQQTALPKIRYMSIPVTEHQYAQLQIFLPPGYSDHEKISFPALYELDGSPGSQLVSKKWLVNWNSYMTSARGFVTIRMDLRGSGFQGDRHRKEVYRRLGEIEVDDAIQVLRETAKLPFIEEGRVCVFGRAYGGFLVTKLLAKNNRLEFNLTKCGIAQSPVARWQLYNSVYTERYMGTPSTTDNWEGYDQADITRDVRELRSQQLMLVHGVGDEFVQILHSMHITGVLSDRGTVFQQMIYPDENHGLDGVQRHLHAVRETFLDTSLGNFTVVFPDDVIYTLADLMT